jgi:predicted DNA-binding transcriptional regulator YafY
MSHPLRSPGNFFFAMDRTARLYEIERLIRHHGHVGRHALMARLEVSRATLKRDLEYLRSRLHAPIDYDPDVNGYRFGQPMSGRAAQRHELPGLWFSESELTAVLMAHRLLSELDGEGVISRHLAPLLARIESLLGQGAEASWRDRVRILGTGKRLASGRFFERVGQALAQRRRLHLHYMSRNRGEATERDVSPQRLVHDRGTWYLDAWCHSRCRLLRFSLDAIEQAVLLAEPARDIPLADVEAAMDAGYGAFAGARPHWARLVFSAQAARWVAHQQWHPQQRGRRLADGRWQLELPYTDPTELVMDLLRHGADVRVLAPVALARQVRERHAAAAAQYPQETDAMNSSVATGGR